MYDSIKFNLTAADVDGVDFLAEIPPYLDPDGYGEHDYSGKQSVTGKVGNLSVSITPNQVSVKNGSLCKWMLGDNYQTMTRRDTQRAVERLSDTLHLPMDRATITRLDVGCTIMVEEPIQIYLNHLGKLKYAKRSTIEDETLYYYRHRRTEVLCFYDKNREQRANGEPIPELYDGKNALRYEQRYEANLPKLLGVKPVTAALLYDERFYRMLLTRWRGTYREINKINETQPAPRFMDTVKNLYRMGILALAEKNGGKLELMAYFDECQKRGKLSATQKHRLIKAVEEAFKVESGFAVPCEAIAELDKKVSDAIKYYR